MSRLSQLKKKVGYQERVPRCSSCRHFSQQHDMRDSVPFRWLMLCERYNFTIKQHGCCDSWESSTGEVLE